MKIDRLIGILSMLLQKDMMTAQELAERFEVSRRTISRDLEDLCKAGIPIQTSRGVNGGIRIMEGFSMDRTLLTSKDMQMIMAGLRSLDSVSGSRYYGQLMEKLKAGSSHLISGRDSILIDLSSWHKKWIEPKITLIEDAIEGRHEISFDYYSAEGESHRRIEPYFLIFKWSSWYVYGFCQMRKDFRLFKLNRMAEIKQERKSFEERPVPVPEFSIEKMFPESIPVEAVFKPEVKFRVVEEFGPQCLTEDDQGNVFFKGEYTDWEGLLSWILSFGDQVTVIKPEELKLELLKNAGNLVKKYERKEKIHEKMV